MLEFYSYRLAVRTQFSSIHHGGKLFQQYIVDAYVKVEGANLDWIRHNQAQLRVEQYCGLVDHLNNQAAELNIQPGRMVILPSTFQVCFMLSLLMSYHHASVSDPFRAVHAT